MVEVYNRAGDGLGEVLSSRGAAFGDIDNDGDIDIVVCNSRERPSLLVNEGGPEKNWVLLNLRGRRNRFAVGARVRLTAGGAVQVTEVHSGSSYVSQNDFRLHFGLGDAREVERVEVRWTEGREEVFTELPAGKMHTLVEGEGSPAGR